MTTDVDYSVVLVRQSVLHIKSKFERKKIVSEAASPLICATVLAVAAATQRHALICERVALCIQITLSCIKMCAITFVRGKSALVSAFID